jgi:hypothetical protein
MTIDLQRILVKFRKSLLFQDDEYFQTILVCVDIYQKSGSLYSSLGQIITHTMHQAAQLDSMEKVNKRIWVGKAISDVIRFLIDHDAIPSNAWDLLEIIPTMIDTIRSVEKGDLIITSLKKSTKNCFPW